jgi:hypothetical protein
LLHSKRLTQWMAQESLVCTLHGFTQSISCIVASCTIGNALLLQQMLTQEAVQHACPPTFAVAFLAVAQQAQNYTNLQLYLSTLLL